MRLDLSAQQKRRFSVSAVFAFAILFLYAFNIVTDPPASLFSALAGAASVFFCILLWVRQVPNLISSFMQPEELSAAPAEGKRSGRTERMHPFFRFFFLILLSRLLLYALVYALLLWQNGYTGGFYDTLRSVWAPAGSYADGYLTLAESGYAAHPELAALFPLWPALVRVLGSFMGGVLPAGLFVGNVCTALSAYLLYELCLLDYARETAKRAMLFFLLLPSAFLLLSPTADSLFLLLSLSCLFYTRKKQYAFASIMGFFAALSRPLGVCLLLPLLIEFAADVLRAARAKKSASVPPARLFMQGLSLLLVPLGLALAMLVGWRSTGNFSAFLVAYRDSYGIHAGWFFAGVSDMADAVLSADTASLWSVALPNLLFALGGLAAVAFAAGRMRPSYALYFVLFTALALGARGAFQAPRDLLTAFPLMPALALLCERRWAARLMPVLCGILQLLLLLAYML